MVLSVVIGIELEPKIIGIAGNGSNPARGKISAFAAENAVGVGIGESGRIIGLARDRRVPLRHTKRGSGIDAVDDGAHARDAKGDRFLRLNEGCPLLIDVARLTYIRRVPIIAEDAEGQGALLGQREGRCVGRVGVGVKIKDIERTRACNLIFPVNLVEPPGKEVVPGVCGLVVVVGAIPVKPPATRDRSEANGRRVPAFERAAFGDESVAQFVIAGGLGMHVAMGAAPYVDFVVHIVKMGCAAKRRSQRGRPLVAVQRVRRIARLRRVF